MTGNKPSNKLFCFGFGYSCERLAKSLRASHPDFEIAGTTRDREKMPAMRQNDIKAYIFDTHSLLPDPVFILKNTTHLLLSIPPNDEGDPALEAHLEEILSVETLKWVGYLSTTGVYGDRNGGWIDETTAVRPSSKRGSRRERVENHLLALHEKHKLPVHIFRLSGIYGPRRSAIDSLRIGTARRIYKAGHVFNRIHVDDIVQVLTASMLAPNPGSIYNLADDLPSPSHDVIEYASQLLGIQPPPLVQFEQADLSPMAKSFYSDCKRIRNDKIKEEFGITLKYPDYKAGLDACYEDMKAAAENPFSCFA